MSRVELQRARYAAMRWNTPLSEAHADRLLEWLGMPEGSSVVDLGCGWGELLLRIVAGAGGGAGGGAGAGAGVGVDADGDLLQRARVLARERGLDGRVRFVHAEAQSWTEPADRVVCIGASHAWGGTGAALRALRQLVHPGGRLLFGDGCWERPPGEAAAAIFDDVAPLREIVAEAQAAGWGVLHVDTADQREWDEFESTWRLGREQWLAANPDHPLAARERAELDARVADYVRAYRGELGFCYLVLGAA